MVLNIVSLVVAVVGTGSAWWYARRAVQNSERTDYQPQLEARWEPDFDAAEEYLTITNNGPLDLTNIQLQCRAGGASALTVQLIAGQYQSLRALEVGDLTTLRFHRTSPNGCMIRLRLDCSAVLGKRDVKWSLARDVPVSNYPFR